ncbi:hypothetical protein ACIPSE_09590 [Streptomyces sp. NPDC090106]|uniref:hypothetical protein n=1 Tax=Streptomyces sp. NPDC090106 TaxID=3365946 RepID=UPI00382E3EFE
MLALRLSRGARPAVQVRRLLVSVASAGTGFLLLCTLGHALGHQDDPAGSGLRLAWCLTPLAATVYFALAVARTDPGTRPRPGLAAIGLGPARLMAVSAATTALSTLLGSMLALLLFLHLRGDLTGMPFDGTGAEFLSPDRPLPLPAALTLLALVPVLASTTVALCLRPRDDRPKATPRAYGRFGAYGTSTRPESFGAYARFGARLKTAQPAQPAEPTDPAEPAEPSGSRAAGAAQAGADGTREVRQADPAPAAPPTDGHPSTDLPPLPAEPPKGLPWGIAILAAGLAAEAYAARTPAGDTPLPTGLTGAPDILLGWLLTAVGLAVAGPGLTHLCGRLLQSARPGALRLLAGRVLMAEATRIGRPLGVVCAVASGTYAMTSLYGPDTPDVGPLTALGLLLVTGCTIATLLTAAVEAKHARADTTAALLRLGAPSTTLRSAAALRAGAVLVLFGPLTLIVAELAALPLVSDR